MRSSELLLQDIRERCAKILLNTNRFSREAFFEDSNAYEATLRHLEIIGEAVKLLPASYKEAHPEMPWRQIARTRDILAHVYFGISEDRIWDILANHIPALSAFCESELRSQGG